MYLLPRIRTFLDAKSSLVIYKSMVLPYLEFGNCFLLSCAKKERLKFQRLQNKCLKIALNKNSLFNTKLLHKEARLADWEHRARLERCRLMYKYKHCTDYIETERVNSRIHDGPIFKQDHPSYVCYL